VGVLLLTVVAYFDWATGPAVTMTCFYVLPIGVMTLALGRTAGYVTSAICTLAWWFTNKSGPEQSTLVLTLWNAGVRLSTFLILTYVIDLSRNLNARIEMLILGRTAELQRELDARNAAEEAIRKLSHQLDIVEDTQRRQIAQDIHDSVGQNLSLLKLQLQSLAATRNDPDLPRIIELLDNLIVQTRTLTFDLHPTMLEDLGLVPTIRHFAKQCSAQAQLPINVSEAGSELYISPHTASTIFRAVKELVLNALKHGRAKEILIGIRWRQAAIRVIVDDDGGGVPLSANEGLGLRWIRQRLSDAQGSIQIESHPGGTRVITDWPLPMAKAQEGAA
jgi:signal transduction histidine kinase